MPKCRKLKHFPLYEQQQSMSERIAFSIEVNEIKQFQVNNPKIDSIRFKSFLYNRNLCNKKFFISSCQKESRFQKLCLFFELGFEPEMCQHVGEMNHFWSNLPKIQPR